MRIETSKIIRILMCLFLFLEIGCEQAQLPAELPQEPDDGRQRLYIYAQYSPVKIDIIPLTEIVSAGGSQQDEINLYVSLLDSFGSQIKSPCVFRFELYQRVQRAAEPKGTRVVLWPDVDLTFPSANNQYWRNFLRAYEFSLPFEPTGGQSYILEVTCICPNDMRLSAEFVLNVSDNPEGK